MKFFIKKGKLYKLIALLCLFLTLINFGPPSYASDGFLGKLGDPIMTFFVGIADAFMNFLERTIYSVENANVHVTVNETAYKVFRWIATVVLAVVAIVACVWLASLIPSVAIGAVIAKGAITVGIVTGTATYFVFYPKIYNSIFPNDYYLPMYNISPYEIFSNKVYLLDVNFFNPNQYKDSEVKMVEKETENLLCDYNPGNNFFTEISDNVMNVLSEAPVPINEFVMGEVLKKKCGLDIDITTDLKCKEVSFGEDDIDNYLPKNKVEMKKYKCSYSFDEGEYNKEIQVTKYTIKYKEDNNNIFIEYLPLRYINKYFNGKLEDAAYYLIQNGDIKYEELKEYEQVFYIKPVIITSNYTEAHESTAQLLRGNISKWYNIIRNICIVALLSILVYIGIRMLLTSVAKDKAKYKQMLFDWIIAFVLMFIMHYIMIFAVTLNQEIINLVDTGFSSQIKKNYDIPVVTATNAEGKTEIVKSDKIHSGVAGFIIDNKKQVKAAWEAFGGDEKVLNESSIYKMFYTDTTCSTNANSKDEANVLLYSAENYMTMARMKAQEMEEVDNGDKKITKSESFAWKLIYCILVIYTIIFLITYVKRVIYLAFLTIIAPLVAMTYPIDKLNDGKAQAYNAWFKEYVFNLLLQPFHLVLYFVLIGSATEFAVSNVIYVIVALGFMMPAEKLLRNFFGFNKATTPGLLGGAAGAALMMSGINRLMHKPLKPNEENDKAENESYRDLNNKIRMNKDNNRNSLDSEGDNNNIRMNDLQTGLDGQSQTATQTNSQSEVQSNAQNASQSNAQNASQSNAQIASQSNAQIASQSNAQSGKTKVGKKEKRAIRKAGRKEYRKAYWGHKFKRIGRKTGKFVGNALSRGVPGIATGLLAAAAGGMAAITSGDASNALKYVGGGALGGYAFGKSIGDKGLEFAENEKSDRKEALYAKHSEDNEWLSKKAERTFKNNTKEMEKLERNIGSERFKELKEKDIIRQYIQNGVTKSEDMAMVEKMMDLENISRDDATNAFKMSKQYPGNLNNMKESDRKQYVDNIRSKLSKSLGISENDPRLNAYVNQRIRLINYYYDEKGHIE